MRIAVGGLSHETNTYADASSGPTPYEAFEVLRGDALVDRFRDARIYVGGLLAGAAEIGAEVVPTLWAGAEPSGTIEQAAYERLRDELLEALAAAAPFDAIALELHGAAVAARTRDVEGELGALLRERFPGVPLVAAADLHGNMTDAMAASFDAVLPVELYPHTDTWERGREAVLLLPGLVDGSLRLTTHVEHLPVLLPPACTDPGQPGARLVELMHEAEQRPGVVDCSVWHGFPFTDTADVGVHVAVTTRDDRPLAAAVAREVAQQVWDHREDFLPDVCSPAEAVARAVAHPGRPVVVNETSDNPGGGTPGDGTHLLRAMLEADLQEACFAFVCDPEVVAAAVTAGVGATISVELGGKTDDVHGKPLPVEAYVKTITDGEWTSRVIAPGYRMGHGRMARLVVGGVDVLVAEQRSQTFEPELFLLHGIDVTRYEVVAVKSSNHFRAGFGPVAAAIVTADSPGLTTLTPQFFEHREATRPMWPSDPAATWSPRA